MGCVVHRHPMRTNGEGRFVPGKPLVFCGVLNFFHGESRGTPERNSWPY